MAFTRKFPVRFHEIDYARVVYYPRFFEYTHQAFEDFFSLELGVSYPQMLQQRKVGYPTVHCEADFKQPLRFGDDVRVVMDVEKISQRAMTCRYRLYRDADETLCATLKVVTVAIAMDTFSATDLPEDVRKAFEVQKMAA